MAVATILDVLSYLPWQWIDTQAVLLFLSVLIVSKYISGLPSKDSPPGPFPWPIIGNWLNISTKDPIGSFQRFVDTYGDVSRVDLGIARCVLLSGYKGFKEAFVEKADSFTDRPPYPLNDRLCKGLGLISSNGPMWRQQRRFALSTLKYFGVGKKTLENSILEESRLLCEALQAEQGSPLDPHCLMTNTVANIVCTLVFGHRFEYDDHDFHHIIECANEILQLPMTFWGRMYNQFPKLMDFLPGKHQTAFSNGNKLKRFIMEEVKRHKEDRTPSNPRDYIDCYLEEIEKNKDETAGFNEENLIYCVVDLFAAGTETTANSLKWAMLYMAKYPTVQEKVQVEIDRMIGQSRKPTMADRANMPYTYAVIHEIQRFGNIVPFTPPRVTNKDTTLSGFRVLKGTVVIPILKSILQDKNEYALPDQFHPEHFLDKNGKFAKGESFIPFSIGKRMCPGEQLAQMELFLFFYLAAAEVYIPPPKGQGADPRVSGWHHMWTKAFQNLCCVPLTQH
ncbi:hypothetical protein SKAU_G00068910 [Synaphobranchus kaupii]|uniref:Cytochrome P450 2J2-like n=1 Tax=Synaphobranchus kaupii TaxID=118154 RepID=A0A9Q1G7A5_SYNKA|nr:hypothetical protein SKAU_G00068910 [Synaphobranchus kaupii]